MQPEGLAGPEARPGARLRCHDQRQPDAPEAGASSHMLTQQAPIRQAAMAPVLGTPRLCRWMHLQQMSVPTCVPLRDQCTRHQA